VEGASPSPTAYAISAIAAILVADVVRYSRLAGADEERTRVFPD
jgi:hypothetical protein